MAITTAQVKTGARLLPYKWELIVWLWCAFFLNQADRQIYNVVLPLIKADLQLTDVQLGLVASVFTWSLGLLVPLSGYAGDVLRRKWIIVLSLLVWSAATMLTGVSGGIALIVLFRSVTAGAEAFYAPSSHSLMGQYHHETRGLAMAIHQTSLYAGVIASGLVAAWIGDHYGWRTAFYLFGGLGVVLAFVASFRLQDTPQPTGESTERLTLATGVRVILQKPTAVAICIGFAGLVFVNVGFLTWMPTFLRERFHLSLAQAGFASMFYHHAAAAVGVLLGGQLSDRWVRRRPQTRLFLQGAGFLLGAPFIYLMGMSESLLLTYFALAGFGIGRGIYDANQYPGLYDVIAPRYRSSAAGIMIAFGFITGAFAPLLLGWVKGRAGLGFGLTLLAGVYLFSSFVVFIAMKTTLAKDYHHETNAYE